MPIIGLIMITSCTFLQTEPVSVSAGDSYFHDRAIGSPYATGIPYALWLTIMDQYPKELGLNWGEFTEKFGLIKKDNDPRGLPVGFVLEHDRLSGTPFLMTNCSLCHTALINKRKIDGLGARTLKLTELNNLFMQLVSRQDFTSDTLVSAAEDTAKRHSIPWDWRSSLAAKMAIKKLKEYSTDHKAVAAGPGRSVPIEFMKEVSHLPVEPPYGYVRFRPVWGYGKRQSFGADGALAGDTALAAATVEFNKRMPPNDIANYKNRFYSIYNYLKTLRSPPYPGLIDKTLADRGRQVYSDHCAECHGSYDSEKKTSYRERIFPIAVIGTDPDRLITLTPLLIATFNHNALGRVAPLRNSGGYVARPLDGIWSCGPYLHNGSVPTLHDLLRPANERPSVFFLVDNSDYDLNKLGIVTRRGSPLNQNRVEASSSFLFDTRLPGNSNKGHEFGTQLSEADRQALIEYLKQL